VNEQTATAEARDYQAQARACLFMHRN